MRQNLLYKEVCIIIFCLVLFSLPLSAVTIHVPSEYPTIQEGLNAAQAGDTVLVAPGTYEENIVWPSCDSIVLISEEGADTTIVDGGGAGRVIDFPSIAFTQATMVTGFTIQNGNATDAAGIYVKGSPHIFENIIQRNIAVDTAGHVNGGGIFCKGTGTPLIEGNLISGNVSRGPDWNHGAGIYVDYQNSAVILGNIIESDSAVGGQYNWGAGIYCDYASQPIIRNNIIQRNIVDAGSDGYAHGGGIYCDGIGDPLIEGNLIRGNVAKGADWNKGAGIYVDYLNSAVILGNIIESDSTIGGSWNYGAGIYCHRESKPDIRHNIIQENVAYQGSRGHGAGIYVYIDSEAHILSNLIYNNTAQSDIWNYGAGMYLYSGAVVYNNTIVENGCAGGNNLRGGGIYIRDSPNTVGNNIIVDNTADDGGGIYAGTNGSATLLNNDVWNNTGGDYYNIAPGPDDISLDPLFVTGPDGNFYLSQILAGQGQDSPCVDYGFASAESLELDTYTTRTDTIPDSGMVDLGYHYPTGYYVSVEEQKTTAPTSLSQVYPSIFSSSCRIQLVLSSYQYVEIHVFDALGRLQKTLFSGKLIAGKHEWVWNGSTIPMGTYFFVVRVGPHETFSKKVILIR